MKPKDFRSPYSFSDRRPLVHDGVLCIPEYYSDWGTYSFPVWEEIFGNSHPVHIEYCSGNGEWIVDKALQHPNTNWVAVEKRYDRVAKIWSKMKNYNLTNLFIVWGEAETATRIYFPDASAKIIYINFPDPWPRKRHHKHRLMKESFVKQMHRVLEKGGHLTLATDDPVYSEFATEQLKTSSLSSLHPEPFYIGHIEGYGNSYFDTLWRSKGRSIRYHQWQKS